MLTKSLPSIGSGPYLMGTWPTSPREHLNIIISSRIYLLCDIVGRGDLGLLEVTGNIHLASLQFGNMSTSKLQLSVGSLNDTDFASKVLLRIEA